MDDVPGYDEIAVNLSDPPIRTNGDYLLIEHEANTRSIYRLTPNDAALHPSVSRILYSGAIYALVGIEEES
ncbi:MAG: hypothetical protein NZ699_00720 [Roseiflexus sp.]|nr:hypothetical protein [Roseiflexus sp.]MCS7287632.1 hypothetical protein [Roseiflexus sp.]MDW8147828.1 hypothetical protein [Roseiflexaceae bacterium]